jgi:carboxyl-terminal processing protease
MEHSLKLACLSCVRQAAGTRSRYDLALLPLVFGLWLGVAGCTSTNTQPDFTLLSQAWNTIHKEYVDQSALMPKELTYGAIAGMVDALGDTGHSSFLTPEMVKDLRRMERGEFKGVGLEIQMKNGRVVVVSPVDDSPAQKAGVKPGEVIVQVGGEDVTDWPLSRVLQQISGRPGTKVTLVLEQPRTGETRSVTLTRASLRIRDVTWQQLPGTQLAHLRVASFDGGVTKDLRRALAQIKQRQLTGIILDLRNNPGGLLDEAISVASQFLATGNVLLSKNAKGEVEPVPVEEGGLATTMPMVVLVNQGSASAAEIVAAALQDAGRAPIVGQVTFGTGTVLEEFRLSDGSALLLAVQEWLTPAGRSFWHQGIKPDVVVALPSDANPVFPLAEKELSPHELLACGDLQLLKALEAANATLDVTDRDENATRRPARAGALDSLTR